MSDTINVDDSKQIATREDVIEMLKTIIDPEIYIDIWSLGLIYGIGIDEESINITMTFTSIACPAGPMLMEEIKEKGNKLAGVQNTKVEVVFDPPWQPSEELKATLGIS
jgi:metal-sulfur cluster biosynthetic enzyme